MEKTLRLLKSVMYKCGSSINLVEYDFDILQKRLFNLSRKAMK